VRRLVVLAAILTLLVVLVGCAPYDPLPDTLYVNNLGITGPQWDDIRTPVTAIKAPAVNPPASVAYKGSEVLAFQDVAGPLEQICYFTIQLSHGYKEGTTLYPHIHWVGSDATVGNVTWTFTYSWANVGDVFPAPTSDTQSFANLTTLDRHNLTYFTPVVGTGKEISSMLLCSLKRNSSTGTDTYTGSAYLLEVDFHIMVDSVGSVAEGHK